MEQTSVGTTSSSVTDVSTVVNSVVTVSKIMPDNSIAFATGPTETPRLLSGVLSPLPSPVLIPQGRIYGRNLNGTMETSSPSNKAELQLYRVLQKASLLAYYDTLLEMGGDDVQQLCDAGEEEFLEIMALVRMASKPLHVRRLQKALNEWAANPSLFQVPLSNTSFQDTNHLVFNSEISTSQRKLTPPSSLNTTTSLISTTPTTSIIPMKINPHRIATSPLSGFTSHQVTSSSPQLMPILTDVQQRKISICAGKIAAHLPSREPRPQSSKKRTTRELEQVMAMSETDSRRMDEIRKYSAIYGRFDCKRRPEKPLTLHEVCVNEAAAQLCKLVPALLTRRDELFPLARQTVKDAGFGPSGIIDRFGMQQQTTSHTEPDAAIKRQRTSSKEPSTPDDCKDSIEDSRYNLFAMYQKFARPPFDLSDVSKFSLNRSDLDDDNDSRFTFSNSNSPSFPTFNSSETDAASHDFEYCREDNITSPVLTDNKGSPSGSQNLSATDGNLCVANGNETISIKSINKKT